MASVFWVITLWRINLRKKLGSYLAISQLKSSILETKLTTDSN